MQVETALQLFGGRFGVWTDLVLRPLGRIPMWEDAGETSEAIEMPSRRVTIHQVLAPC